MFWRGRQEGEQKVEKRYGVFRFAWYIFATVLVLSLPTFSYLVPDPDVLFRSAETEAAEPESSEKKKAKRRYSEPPRAALSNFSLSRRVQPSSQPRVRRGLPPKNSRARNLRERTTAGTPSRKDSTVEVSSNAQQQADADGSEQTESRQQLPLYDQAYGPMEGGAQAALAQLEQGYQDVARNFGNPSRRRRRGASNPFQDALDSGTDGATDGTDGNNSSSGDSSSGDSGGGDSSGTGGGSEDPDLDVIESPPDQPFNFVVVGSLTGNPSSSVVSRATREGDDFVLDNFFRFSFYPGVLHGLSLFEEDSTILTCDLNRDNVADFVATRVVPAVGTSIEAFVGTGAGYEPYASTVLFLQAVRSVALFDFDVDGQAELTFLVEGQPNLIVYKKVDKNWQYMKELVLPIQSGLMFTSRLVQDAEPALFIIDRNLQQAVTLTAEQPNLFQFGLDLPLTRLRSLDVSWSSQDSGASVRVFELPDRIVLVEQSSELLNPFVSLDLTMGVPFLIVGDYSGTGSRQVLWIQ
jgi:uncharacterized membrane protein YgcG